MSFNSFLGLSSSSSEDEEEVEVKIERNKPKEEEILVDISAEKAIEEEITYQRVQSNYTTEMKLNENKETLLKFLEGSMEFLKEKGTKDIWAARAFIDLQVSRYFLDDTHFSKEEKAFLEDTVDSVARILNRIQCRKYVLDKGLQVSSTLVDNYFVNARTKANKAEHDRINKEADRMLAAKVRANLLSRFSFAPKVNEEPQKKKSHFIPDDDEDSYDSDLDIDLLIGSLEKQNIHCEFSQNEEFEDICDSLLRQLVRTHITDVNDEDDQECQILSSPPASPPQSPPPSPEGSRPASPEASESPEDAVNEEDVNMSDEEANEVMETEAVCIVPVKGILRKTTKYGNLIRSHETAPKTKRLRFCDARENKIKLFTRASEEEINEDLLWKRNDIKLRRWYNDTGNTIWHETFDGKRGSKYLLQPCLNGKASTFSVKTFVMGDSYNGKDILPTSFCLPSQRTYPVVQNAVAELELPTYIGLQPRLNYYQTKTMNALSSYFKTDVFSRLCNFHYDLLGYKSANEYIESNGSSQGRQFFYHNYQPQYNKLMLTDSIMGQCNPMTLLNTCLLVCNPNIDHKMFINSMFDFIRSLVTTDVSAKRKDELKFELQDEVDLNYCKEYGDVNFYNNRIDFDVSGGVFLCFGHDILVHYEQLQSRNNQQKFKNPELLKSLERLKKQDMKVNYDVQLAALAECICLTNKVIYELKEVWTLMNWWSVRQFPDIWLITLPEGRNGDFIKVFNMLLREVVTSKEMFPVCVKLIDWSEVLTTAHENNEHDMNAIDEDSVEDRFNYLFRLMRQNADVRYRRTQEERKWDAEQPRNYKNIKDFKDKVI